MKSHSSQNISDLRRHLLYMAVFPVLIAAISSVVFITVNGTNNGIKAASNYLPPYDPQALFNQPIPNNYPTDPNSAAIISRISTDFNRVAFSNAGEVPPVYNVNNSMAQYAVSWGGVNITFPASTNVRVGGGADHPLILLNTDTQVELRLWQATINHGSKTINASNGGRFYYNNDGRILNPNGSRSTSIPFSGGGTGSGLSYLAGLVTNEDFDSGVIHHAIRFANSCSNSTATFRPPANKTDQPYPTCTTKNPTAASSIEMGSILQLDKAIDCNGRTVPNKPNTSKETQLVRMVCKAMQDYGIIMLDGTGAGGGANFYLEDSITAQWNLDDAGRGNYGWMFRPPYYSGDGINRNGSTDGIPYNKFRVTAKPASNISWGAGTTVTPAPVTTPSPGPDSGSSMTTPPPISSAAKPVAPNNLKLTAGDHSLIAQWTASPVNEKVDSYQVYLNGALTFTSTKVPNFTITGTPGQTYNVRVSAHNSSGFGPWSALVSGVIGQGLGAPPPQVIPAPPAPVVALPGANTKTPVTIPITIPKDQNGTIVADFTGDGVNDIAKDINNDGAIDPTNEILSEEIPINSEEHSYAPVADSEGKDIDKTQKTANFGLTFGPVKNAQIPKPVAYTFLTAQTFVMSGLGAYLAITKLSLLATLRGKLGL